MNNPPGTHSEITVAACRCCATARWHCGHCGRPGAWPVPSPEPEWPVRFEGACPSCRSSLTLLITGYGPERPGVSKLERALRLPPARRPRKSR